MDLRRPPSSSSTVLVLVWATRTSLRRGRVSGPFTEAPPGLRCNSGAAPGPGVGPPVPAGQGVPVEQVDEHFVQTVKGLDGVAGSGDGGALPPDLPAGCGLRLFAAPLGSRHPRLRPPRRPGARPRGGAGGARPPDLPAGCVLRLFDAQLGSRHLDLAARWLRGRGEGFYTIGSAGHEGNAAVAAALRPTDPALLHYRSGAFFVERAGQGAGGPGPGGAGAAGRARRA